MTSTKTALLVADAFKRFDSRLSVGVNPLTFASLFDSALLPRHINVDRNADALLFNTVIAGAGDANACERFENLLDALADIYMGDRRIESLSLRWQEFEHEARLATTCAHCGKDISTADEFLRDLGFCGERCSNEYDEQHPEER